jgi:hypothetical protein
MTRRSYYHQRCRKYLLTFVSFFQKECVLYGNVVRCSLLLYELESTFNNQTIQKNKERNNKQNQNQLTTSFF